MTLTGLDYVTGPPVATLKTNNIAFVCRYLSFVNDLTKVKLLTFDEAKTLSQGGLAIVSNYEWYGTRATEGSASGVQDAQIARDQHAACGGPADRPIYFSVDEDVAGSQVASYFQGVASAIGLERTGAYGSDRVLKYLFDNNLIRWGWQTYAWSGGLWEPRAHIYQYQNGVNLDGFNVDYNHSNADDFGQWTQGESMLQLTDPMGRFFTSNQAGDHWTCAETGFNIAYGLLGFYRQNNGIFGLPKSAEIYLQQYPNTAIQYCERALMVYDPGKKIDNVPGAGDCYLLHIDSGIGQQAVAKDLLTALQTQVNDLTAQVTTLTAELAKAGDPALQQQIDELTTKLTAAKSAVASCAQSVGAL